MVAALSAELPFVAAVRGLLSRSQCGDVLGRYDRVAELLHGVAVVREEWVFSMLQARARGHLPARLHGHTLVGLQSPLYLCRGDLRRRAPSQPPTDGARPLLTLLVDLDGDDAGDAVWFEHAAPPPRLARHLLVADVLYAP